MAQCKSCGAEILWAQSRNGGLFPVDREPRADGNVQLHQRGAALPDAEVYGREAAEKLRELGVVLHVSHFATCPNARRHRRR